MIKTLLLDIRCLRATLIVCTKVLCVAGHSAVTLASFATLGSVLFVSIVRLCELMAKIYRAVCWIVA